MLDNSSQTSKLAVSVEREIPDYWPSVRGSAEGHCHVFQTREFIDAWMRSFGVAADKEPYFVVVRRAAGELALLLPLCITRRRGVRVLSFIDDGQADYNVPVLFETAPEWTPETVRALWGEVLRQLPPVDVVLLEKMPEFAGPLPNPMRLLATGPEVASSHGNRLDLPWPEVEKHIYRPKEVLRKERALSRAHSWRVAYAETPQERKDFVAALIEQKQHRYEQTNVPGFAENPASLTFLRIATETFAETGSLMLVAVLVDDEAAAVQWGLTWRSTAYGLWTSFLPGPLSQFSCGRILHYRLIEGMHREGYRYFDQGFGDEAYKLTNTDTVVPLFRAEFATSLQGRLYLGAGRLRAGLRESSLGQRLRPLKWVVLRRLGLSRVGAREDH